MITFHTTNIILICAGLLIFTNKVVYGEKQMELVAEIESSRINFDKIKYPYKADFIRSEHIKCKSSRVQMNMTPDEVEKLLDKPDLISFVYDTRKKGKITGFYYFYLLRQDAKNGSQTKMNQQSIMVYFDLNRRVCRVIGKNTPFFDNIMGNE